MRLDIYRYKLAMCDFEYTVEKSVISYSERIKLTHISKDAELR